MTCEEREEYPLVSVVIPCYNAADFIGDAINSALQQDYYNVEVIIIDDGSTDSSAEIIRSFSNKLRCYYSEHLGGAAARNRGLTLSRGQFVQFLDADDWLLPDKLKVQVPQALTAGPGAMSFSLGTTDGQDPYFDWQYGRSYEASRDALDFVLGGVLPTPAPLHFKSDLLRVGGFDETLPCAQEFDLHLRLVCSGVRLVQIKEPLFVVRRQSNSVSADSMRVTRQMPYILSKGLVTLRLQNALSKDRARMLAVAYARVAIQLRLGGYRDEAAKCRRDALLLCPDADILLWTPRWRPAARLFGSMRVAWLRHWVNRLRGGQ